MPLSIYIHSLNPQTFYSKGPIIVRLDIYS